jgi:hypothetical protein
VQGLSLMLYIPTSTAGRDVRARVLSEASHCTCPTWVGACCKAHTSCYNIQQVVRQASVAHTVPSKCHACLLTCICNMALCWTQEAALSQQFRLHPCCIHTFAPPTLLPSPVLAASPSSLSPLSSPSPVCWWALLSGSRLARSYKCKGRA